MNGHSQEENGIFDSDSDSECADSDDDVIIESSKDVLSTANIARLIRGHHLNAALRICCLWLMNSRPVVVEAAGEKSDVVWLRLAKLFSTLSLDNPDYLANDEISAKVKACQDVIKKRPLPEDFEMMGLKAFGTLQVDHRDLINDMDETDVVSCSYMCT